MAAPAALILLVVASLPPSYSSVCKSGGDLIIQVEETLFTKKDHLPYEENSSAGVNASLSETNNSSCNPHFLNNTNVLILSGKRCNQLPTLNDGYEIIIDKIVLQRTFLQTVPEDFFRSWSSLKELEISENENLVQLSRGAFNSLSSLEKLLINKNTKLSKLNENSFVNLINLKELSLRGNSISHISEITNALKLSHLPTLSSLDLSDNPITSIGKQDLDPLLELKLEKLTLKNIEFNHTASNMLCNATTLTTLELGSYFSPIVFTKFMESIISCKSLSVIKLHNVDLIKNSEKFLTSMSDSSLTTLRLRNARVDKIEANETSAVMKLEEIEITESFFKEFPSGFFDQQIFPSIIKITLRTNKFNSVPSLIPESSVKLLDLSGSEIIILKEKHFYFAPKARALILSKTKLKQIENNAFIDNKYLEFLDLSHNDFYETSRTFDKVIFNGLNSLTALDMSYSKISALPTNIFEYLTNVQLISLRSNDMKVFDLEIISSLPCLRKLDLRENKIFSFDLVFFKIERIVSDISLFSAIYELNEEVLHWLHFINSIDNVLKPLANCSTIHVTSNEKQLIRPLKTNKEYGRCEIVIKKEDGNSTEKGRAENSRVATDRNNRTVNETKAQIEHNRYEFIYVLFRPTYVFETMTHSTTNALRFLYVFSFYLILFLLMALLIVKLVNAVRKYKKGRRASAILYQDRLDYLGIENKGYNAPYERSKDSVLKTEQI